jgi:hypothetical protein
MQLAYCNKGLTGFLACQLYRQSYCCGSALQTARSGKPDGLRIWFCLRMRQNGALWQDWGASGSWVRKGEFRAYQAFRALHGLFVGILGGI